MQLLTAVFNGENAVNGVDLKFLKLGIFLLRESAIFMNPTMRNPDYDQNRDDAELRSPSTAVGGYRLPASTAQYEI